MFEIVGKMTLYIIGTSLYIIGTLFCGFVMNTYDFDAHPISFAAAK